MHLTCTNMPEEKLRDALDKLKGYGIQNVLALRGDPPKGQESFTVVEGGFACALDLVKYIRRAPGRGPRQGRGCPWGRPAPCCRCPSVAERTAAEGGAACVFTRSSMHVYTHVCGSQWGCLPVWAVKLNALKSQTTLSKSPLTGSSAAGRTTGSTLASAWRATPRRTRT